MALGICPCLQIILKCVGSLFQSAMPSRSVTAVEGTAGSGARRGKTRHTGDAAASAGVVWPRTKVAA